LRWERRTFNCADAVERILVAGGYMVGSPSGIRAAYSMPLDVFDRALRIFQADPMLRTQLIGYRKLTGSQASYRYSRFPLSVTQPIRSLARVVAASSSDTLEGAVTRQVGVFGDGRLLVEDLHPRRATSSSAEANAESRSSLASALLADAARLCVTRAGSLRDEFEGVLDRGARYKPRQSFVSVKRPQLSGPRR
jgi:hypothetical protein